MKRLIGVFFLFSLGLWAQGITTFPQSAGGSGLTACSATPPTTGAAGSVCAGTDGNLYSCSSASYPSGCTSGQFVVSPGARTWPYRFQGIVQAGVAGFTANLPASGAPTPTNIGGTDPAAVLEWPISQSVDYAWWNFELPTGYVSNANISYTIESRSADSTGGHTAIVSPYWSCVSTGAVDAQTWNAVSTFTIQGAAASGRVTTTGTLAPTCAAGARAGVKLKIDTNTNGMTQPFDLISLTLSVQGGM